MAQIRPSINHEIGGHKADRHTRCNYEQSPGDVSGRGRACAVSQPDDENGERKQNHVDEFDPKREAEQDSRQDLRDGPFGP